MSITTQDIYRNARAVISIGTGFYDGYTEPLLSHNQYWIKIAGRNINNLRYADDATLMAESEEELKNLLMKVKVESENLA